MHFNTANTLHMTLWTECCAIHVDAVFPSFGENHFSKIKWFQLLRRNTTKGRISAKK